jgi:hypothetical protein
MTSPVLPGQGVCLIRVTVESGVNRGHRLNCAKKPREGQDYCEFHLNRMPYMRNRKDPLA